VLILNWSTVIREIKNFCHWNLNAFLDEKSTSKMFLRFRNPSHEEWNSNHYIVVTYCAAVFVHIRTRSSRKNGERGYSFDMWCNKPRQGASRCIRRKLFCKEVIEEDSIFPRRHRGLGIVMVTASVMRIAFLLLHVFVVWRRFLWRGFSFNPRARSQYCSQCVSFYKFSLYSAPLLNARGAACLIPST